MDCSSSADAKQHAVCLPFPAQGHINPMMELAKILHSRDFHVTFVNTDYNHRRLLKSKAASSSSSSSSSSYTSLEEDIPDFCFASIPDGLPLSDDMDVTQDITSLCQSIMANNPLVPFCDLLTKLNLDSSCSTSSSKAPPPVTCIISDFGMSFAVDAARRLGLGIPVVLLCTTSSHVFVAHYSLQQLIKRGFSPLKDASLLNEKEGMERKVEGIPVLEGMRFKDYPTFIRTTDPEDFMLKFIEFLMSRASMATALIPNTFQELEAAAIESMKEIISLPILPIGPLSLMSKKSVTHSPLGSSSLWKEDRSCLQWLEGRPDASVVYVNFGSITILTEEQLMEFAWGIANSNHEFLWVIRPDLVRGEGKVDHTKASEWSKFVEETKGRGLIVSWCPQVEVLNHPSVGLFLTHCGWNSTMESVCGGVPMLCWPFFADQQTNCWFICNKWGIGREIDGGDMRREVVKEIIEELMSGEKGKELGAQVRRWKHEATVAASQHGSSCANLDRFINNVLMKK